MPLVDNMVVTDVTIFPPHFECNNREHACHDRQDRMAAEDTRAS